MLPTTSAQGHILIVDDEVKILKLLSRSFLREGHDVKVTTDPSQALRMLRTERFDVLLVDHRMPGLSGLDLLKACRETAAPPAVIMITAYATVPSAVEAMKLGACDYIQKPFDFDRVKEAVRRALARPSPAGAAAAEAPARDGAEQAGWHGLVGSSEALGRVLRRVEAVARTDSTVLLVGETGTGKELVARAIHRLSPRAAMPLVRVNCAAIPDGLLESEMFGHVRGAFTGATQSRRGKFASADRGTLFLDEVSGLGLALQRKLLRALQEMEVEPLGADRALKLDVRLVAATNRDLRRLVAEGRFQEDLYYRLNVIPIRLPPLRERREDIPALAEHFLARFARRLGRPARRLSEAARDRLLAYDWPGNVRELENAIERAVAFSSGEVLDAADLVEIDEPPSAAASQAGGLRQRLSRVTRQAIVDALREANGKKKDAARRLGLSPRALSYYLRKYGL